ncbi:MAG TPA: hypothetical protein VK880_04845 [Anaerolineales bacterium]|nr:hypothetical protein [Anaerolineales bacterium]
MKAKWFSILLVITILVVAVVPSVGAAPSTFQGSSPAPDKIVVSKFGTTSIGSGGGSPGNGTLGPIATEIQKPKRLGSSPLRSDPGAGGSGPLGAGSGSSTSAGKKTKSNPEINLSFEGLNHLDSRLAFGGNQFSGEPADQGLCVGKGYILETVNSALQVYSANSGAPASPVLALNEFYGFPPAIDRTGPELVFGPFTFDISCHYDPDSNRWFHLAVDLDQNPVTGDFTGKNYLDLAVSTSSDPRGSWNIYRIPGMNDGSEGTPDHNCAGGPCFADFPHIGVDKNGVYITTNEFPLFEDGFTGAQVYAISKQALVNGANSIDVYLFDTSQPAWQVRDDEPGFTLWPALSAGKQFETDAGGSNYFVSSNAVFDDANGDSEEIIVWALSNTSSLNSASPSLQLTRTIVPSLHYAVPPPSVQKSGPFPLGECLNDTSGSVGGVNCGLALFGLPPQNVSIGPIDTSDSRVLGANYANGKLWAVLATAAEVAGQQRAGVGWFIFNASVSGSGVSATIRKQGILAVEGESLAYPTVGVTTSGRGIIGFTRVGENLFPSYGYASIDDKAGAGSVHMIREGQSTQDGFTEYPPIGGNRPRWGDYGAAAVDGKNVYLAGQYIEQPPCTLADFVSTGFTCFGFRSSLANWSTRVTKLTP